MADVRNNNNNSFPPPPPPPPAFHNNSNNSFPPPPPPPAFHPSSSSSADNRWPLQAEVVIPYSSVVRIRVENKEVTKLVSITMTLATLSFTISIVYSFIAVNFDNTYGVATGLLTSALIFWFGYYGAKNRDRSKLHCYAIFTIFFAISNLVKAIYAVFFYLNTRNMDASDGGGGSYPNQILEKRRKHIASILSLISGFFTSIRCFIYFITFYYALKLRKRLIPDIITGGQNIYSTPLCFTPLTFQPPPPPPPPSSSSSMQQPGIVYGKTATTVYPQFCPPHLPEQTEYSQARPVVDPPHLPEQAEYSQARPVVYDHSPQTLIHFNRPI